jgi:ferredoxin
VKLTIEDFCVRCGICIDTAPDLFERDEANDAIRVKIDDIPESLSPSAREAADSCAVSAIRLVE